MTKKRVVHSVQDETKPRVLIAGSDGIIQYLKLDIKNRGCEVESIEYKELSDEKSFEIKIKYDYIFLIDNHQLTDKLLTKFLSPFGKMLFVETGRKELPAVQKDVTYLRVGDVKAWQVNDLSEKILKTIFSSNKYGVLDVRKYLSAQELQMEENQENAPPPVTKPIPLPPIVIKAPFPFWRTVFFTLVFVIIILGSVTGFVLYNVYSLKDSFSRFGTHLASSDWKSAESDLAEIKTQIGILDKVQETASNIFFPLKNTAAFTDAENIITLTNRLVVNVQDLLVFLRESFKDSGSFPGQRNLVKDDFVYLDNKLTSLQSTIIAIKNQMDSLNVSYFPKEEVNTILTSLSTKIVAVSDILPLAQKVLFTEKPVTYLFLFQNNMELRPTGGFIGSYAILTVKDGKIIDYKIEDVYTADGQLKGHVEPPLAIRKYLNQPNFFLRDSNFDPDFAASAIQASWFLQKEMNIKADTVVAVNLFLVQDLLRIVNGINLTDFGNEYITADNFFTKANDFAQNKFFPGSTKKRDFLTSVANTLLSNFTFDRQNVLFKVLPVVKKALDEKNILIYSFDEQMQKTVEEKGYGGRISQIKCAQGLGKNSQPVNDNSCYADFLSINEANLGVNKVNYFMNKSVVIEKKVNTDGTIGSLVTVSYENSATPEIYKDAVYSFYLRFFLPYGSTFKGITYNNNLVSQSQVDIENYGADKISIGSFFKIAPGSRGIVKIAYVAPQKIISGTTSYQLSFSKQGGDKVSPLVLSLTYPKNLQFTAHNFKSVSNREDEVYYSTDTSVDRIFSFEIKK